MVGAAPEIGDVDLLREVYLSPDPIVTAPEMAERTGYVRQNIHYRFSRFVERGWLKSRDVGSHATVFWITDEGINVLVGD